MGTSIGGKPAADALDGTEILPGRQDGNDVRITAAQIAALAPGGSGLPPQWTDGEGSPVGVLDPETHIGWTYRDTLNGALYAGILHTHDGPPGDTAGWYCIGGFSVDDDDNVGIPGVGIDSNGRLWVMGSIEDGVKITDPLAAAGTQNALFWAPNGIDGQQILDLTLGSSGQYSWQWHADGSTRFPRGGVGGVWRLFSSDGDPNGVTEAVDKGDLCLDYTTPALWIAPAAGMVWERTGPHTLPSGAIGTSASEPADGDIQPGECFRWFDPTPGAAGVGWKAKDANGIVVTGFDPLT